MAGGRRLGKYELIELLGKGATAEVFKGRDTALGREVAVKVLKAALVADDDAFGRFALEAQSAAQFFHPGIAAVLDIGSEGSDHYIVMQYVEGQTLAERIRTAGPLEPEEVLALARQVGAALDHAHAAGVLHRDVKPSNILCTPKGDYVLTDFGLARAVEGGDLTSHTGLEVQSPHYLVSEKTYEEGLLYV
jgi:eukaryotic-like serine/threonine-protein kinase